MTMRYERPRFAVDEHNTLYDLKTGHTYENLIPESPCMVDSDTSMLIDLHGVRESIKNNEHTHHHFTHIVAAAELPTDSPSPVPPAVDMTTHAFGSADVSEPQTGEEQPPVEPEQSTDTAPSVETPPVDVAAVEAEGSTSA